MKKIIIPIALLGTALLLFADYKAWNSIGISTEEKKQTLRSVQLFENDLTQWTTFLNTITPNEVDTVYQVLIIYKHVNSAPPLLQQQFNLISEKYNIFT